MIQLAINTLVSYATPEGDAEELLCIIWISGDGSTGYWIDLNNSKSLPVPFIVDQVREHLLEGSADLRLPTLPVRSGSPSDKARRLGEERWRALGPILTREPEIYDARTRSGFYREGAEALGITLNPIRDLFQAFWRGGKVPDALIPRFDARGGKGKVREPGTAKRGRPVITSQIGLNINREMRRTILAVVARERKRMQRLDLPHCYKVWANLIFYQDGVDDSGAPARVLQEKYIETGIVSYDAFVKCYYASVDQVDEVRRTEPRRYALSARPLVGSATAETWGPGSRYLIDATMADIYLLSRINRSRIVGRPVIYIVIDVWSRLILGLYVAIEDASWQSAMMALVHAAGSKVEYCRRFGIEIREEHWPRGGIGARLLADQGEVDCEIAGNLVKYFNCEVEVAEAGRGDLKAIVETQYNVLQVRFGAFVPGYVRHDRVRDPSRDYRLDAVFDVHEFEATMVDLVLERNQKLIEKYDRDQGMPVGEVAASPLELFHWGLQHRTGRMHFWPDEYLRFRLLPTATAVIDRHGLRFKDRHYISPGILASGAMSKARMGHSVSAEISYFPNLTDVVFMHDPTAPHGYEICCLTDRSRASAGVTMAEDELERLEQKALAASRRIPELTNAINVDQRMEERIQAAKARRPSAEGVSKKSRLSEISSNRKAERSADSKRVSEKLTIDSESHFKLDCDLVSKEDYDEATLSDFIRNL